jgi:hypothetical protein
LPFETLSQPPFAEVGRIAPDESVISKNSGEQSRFSLHGCNKPGLHPLQTHWITLGFVDFYHFNQ